MRFAMRLFTSHDILLYSHATYVDGRKLRETGFDSWVVAVQGSSGQSVMLMYSACRVG